MFVVDGYNAIRRIERFRRVETRSGLEAGRDALLTAILSSGILSSERVFVVFDGTREIIGATPSLHRALTVRFSRAPENADRTILSYIESQRRPEEVVLVSADEELAQSARRLGASVMAPESWNVLRPPKPRVRARADTTAADKPRASRSDVEYWLRIFDDRDDEG